MMVGNTIYQLPAAAISVGANNFTFSNNNFTANNSYFDLINSGFNVVPLQFQVYSESALTAMEFLSNSDSWTSKVTALSLKWTIISVIDAAKQNHTHVTDLLNPIRVSFSTAVPASGVVIINVVFNYWKL